MLYKLAQRTSRAHWYKVWHVKGWFTKNEHGFSPTGEFPFCSFFLGWGFVLFSVRATLVRQCCMNVEEFIKLVWGGGQ